MSHSEIVAIPVFLLITGISLFFIFFVMGEITESLSNSPMVNVSEQAIESLETGTGNLNDKLDYVFFFVLIGLTLANIITSYFLSSNKLFIIVFIMVWTLMIVLSPIFSNVWEEITQKAAWGITIQSFPITNYIMLFLPLVVMVEGFIGGFAMYINPEGVLQ